MKRLVTMALLLCFALPMMAQNKNKKVEDRIQLAREKYSEGLALIAENSADQYPLNYTIVVRKQNWAAVGMRSDSIWFYYNELRDDEEEPYPDGYALRMVHRTYNVAARDYLEEYLFDDNGKPLFFFTHFTEMLSSIDDTFEFEVRYYYDENGKIIRSIFKLMDEKGKMKEITSKSHPEVVQELDGLTSPDFDYVKMIFDAIY